MPVTPHACPHCGTHTSYIHDYRRQLIKDIPAFGQSVILNYRRRRYRCPHCGKCFSEQHPFVPRYHRMTSRLVAHIIDQLRCECSFTSVAKSVNLSVSTELRQAYYLKETFYTVIDAQSREEAKKLMADWILSAQILN